MVEQGRFAKWSRNSVLFAKRCTVYEIWPFEVFDVKTGSYFFRRSLYDARAFLRYSSRNSRTQIAVTHGKWSNKAVSRNDREIRSFSPNDAPLTRYNLLKMLMSRQGVISSEGHWTMLEPFSAIAPAIRGLKLQLHMKNGRTRPFRGMITKFGPFHQTTHR